MTPTPPTPEIDISLEEWIAAGQGCCGRELNEEEPQSPVSKDVGPCIRVVDE